MKKPPTKNELRQRLERQTAAFLSKGGKVRELSVGESAYDRSEMPPPAPLFEARKTTRTPLTEVIAALDAGARKRPRTRSSAPNAEASAASHCDDFGEPLRVIWVEE